MDCEYRITSLEFPMRFSDGTTSICSRIRVFSIMLKDDALRDVSLSQKWLYAIAPNFPLLSSNEQGDAPLVSTIVSTVKLTVSFA